MTSDLASERRAFEADHWEYRRRQAQIISRTTDDMLADFGKQGWELCAVMRSHPNWDAHFYFKRRLTAALTVSSDGN